MLSLVQNTLVSTTIQTWCVWCINVRDCHFAALKPILKSEAHNIDLERNLVYTFWLNKKLLMPESNPNLLP